jgi:hypothetical protein
VVDTTEHAVVPAIDIAVGTVLLTIVWVIRTGRDTWWRERIARFREERGDKPTPRWRRALRTGSPRVAFVVGVCLTLPGVAYLIGMNAIADQGYSDVDAVAAVVLFCAIMLLLVEVPLVAALFAPERADRAIEHVGAYLRANIRTILLRVGMIVGALIALRGVLTALGVI